jgi:RND family efflux transporter MFP subunit
MLKKPTFYLAIIGVIMAFLLVGKLRQPDPEVPPLAPPTSAPFANSVGASGLVESVNENVRIAPTTPGLVAVVNVTVGDTVKKGEVLFSLDDRDAKAAIASQQAQVGVLRSSVALAEVALADKTDALRRVEKLSRNQVSSDEERTRADFALRQASASLARTKAELEQAQADLSRAQVTLERLTTLAPRDGRVLQVNIRAGEQAVLDGDKPAMLLGDIDEFQLRADVDEDHAARVLPGSEAVAFLKGSRDKKVQLRFVRIEPYIVPKQSLTGLSSERVDTRVLQIIFRFDRPNFPVYVGQQMDVFLNGDAARKM